MLSIENLIDKNKYKQINKMFVCLDNTQNDWIINDYILGKSMYEIAEKFLELNCDSKNYTKTCLLLKLYIDYIEGIYIDKNIFNKFNVELIGYYYDKNNLVNFYFFSIFDLIKIIDTNFIIKSIS